MRCKNCGWENPNSATVCEKCNLPLDSSFAEQSYASPISTGRDLKKTVLESDVFANPMGGSANQEVPTVCPKCGYPLRPGSTSCPNCNFQIQVSQPALKSQPTVLDAVSVASSASSISSINQHKRPVYSETVNPYLETVEVTPSFTLSPVSRINEKKHLEPISFEGESVMLNRDNTETDNTTISSASQATITCVDDKWFIKDSSGQGTTFVKALNEIEIKDGDVILLGNRLFEFHV